MRCTRSRADLALRQSSSARAPVPAASGTRPGRRASGLAPGAPQLAQIGDAALLPRQTAAPAVVAHQALGRRCAHRRGRGPVPGRRSMWARRTSSARSTCPPAAHGSAARDRRLGEGGARAPFAHCPRRAAEGLFVRGFGWTRLAAPADAARGQLARRPADRPRDDGAQGRARLAPQRSSFDADGTSLGRRWRIAKLVFFADDRRASPGAHRRWRREPERPRRRGRQRWILGASSAPCADTRGLPITLNNGIVTGAGGGAGWHLELDGGAPMRLTISHIQVTESL